MTDYAKVLAHKYKGSEWTLSDNNYETLIWMSDSPKPTKDELDVANAAMEQELLQFEAQAKAAKQAILDRLGLTEDELRIVLS